MQKITFDPPRPTLTEDMKQTAAVCFVRAHPHIQDDRDVVDVAYDIAEACATSILMDGYELAKKLEVRFYWHIDAQTVSNLDEVSFYMHGQLRYEESLWVKTHNIQPPFAIGTEVVCRHGHICKGTITGVSEHEHAAYLIQIPGEPENNRAIVKFEDCWMEESAA